MLGARLTARALQLGASRSGSSRAMDSTAAIRPGLERILPLLIRLDSPQKRFPVIHIAGTNSKGTTSSILDSTLRSLGIRTARFNSPHLKEERDAVRICGNVVDARTWSEASERVAEADQLSSSEHDLAPLNASPFELLFARFLVSTTLTTPPPQVLIVECGMGGRDDATNVFPSSNVLASVITPIGSDHKAFLGETLSEITEHKMGIAKEHGLVVVADQRGPEGFKRQRESGARSRNAHLTRWDSESERTELVGHDTSQVLSTIRRVGETIRARLVKCETPFDAAETSKPGNDPSRPWEITSQWRAVLPPTLQSLASTSTHEHDAETGVSLSEDGTTTAPTLSTSTSLAATLYTNTPYHSTGSPPLTTPVLPALPPTYPVLSSLSTALCTLYSIASDEPPSARLHSGGDPHEELRLSLAFGLQSTGILRGEHGIISDDFESAIVDGVRSWSGRGSWVDVPSPQGSLHAFLDGAHNTPALKALISHLKTITTGHPKPPQTLTILAAFSSSKEKDGDLDTILELFAALPGSLRANTSIDSLSLNDPPTVRFGFLPFTTPVEGMPWVQPLDGRVLKERVDAKGLKDVQAFDSLPNALAWAEQGGLDGKPSTASMLVVTGSLYLVADVYRLIDGKGSSSSGQAV